MRKLLIVLHHRFDLWNAPPWFAERLRDAFPQVQVVHLSDYDHLEDEIRDAEIVVAWSLRPQQLTVAKKLRWIHSPAAAVHQLIFPELVNSDVVLSNAREVHGPVVAEHVMALILALAKKIPQSVRFQQRHIWGQQQVWSEPPRPREVMGATLGLVGLGSIGREVAKRASAFGIRIIASREHPEKGAPKPISSCWPLP
jgi:phosphoglycerate dehydrogenase-like enzyme